MAVTVVAVRRLYALNTRASLATKLTIEHTAMATAFAATASIANLAPRTATIPRLPASDTAPFSR